MFDWELMQAASGMAIAMNENSDSNIVKTTMNETRTQHVVTIAWLRKHGACCKQAKQFHNEFGDSLTLTPDVIRKASVAGYDLRWFSPYYLSAEPLRAYDAAMAEAQPAYDAARAEALCAYKAAGADAYRAYDAAMAEPQRAYDAAGVDAAGVDAAMADAQCAYQAAMAEAQRAYDAARAEALIAALWEAR